MPRGETRHWLAAPRNLGVVEFFSAAWLFRLDLPDPPTPSAKAAAGGGPKLRPKVGRNLGSNVGSNVGSDLGSEAGPCRPASRAPRCVPSTLSPAMARGIASRGQTEPCPIPPVAPAVFLAVGTDANRAVLAKASAATGVISAALSAVRAEAASAAPAALTVELAIAPSPPGVGSGPGPSASARAAAGEGCAWNPC